MTMGLAQVPTVPVSSKTLRPYVPTRRSGGLALESSARDVQSTVGSPAPRTCHVAPRSNVLMTAASLATTMVCGEVPGSMTTECRGRSGRFWLASPPSVPLMSFQFAPLSVVRKTCFLRFPALHTSAQNPGYTTTISAGDEGSIASPLTARPVGAPVTVCGENVVDPAPASALLVFRTVPFSRPTHMMFESILTVAMAEMAAAKVHIRVKVAPPSVLWNNSVLALPDAAYTTESSFGSTATLTTKLSVELLGQTGRPVLAASGKFHVSPPSVVFIKQSSSS